MRERGGYCNGVVSGMSAARSCSAAACLPNTTQCRRARLMRMIIAAQVVLQGRDHGWVRQQFAELAEFAVADRRPLIASKSSLSSRSPLLRIGCRQHANQCPSLPAVGPTWIAIADIRTVTTGE